MTTKRLILIRHGESASNAGKSTADPESIPLTEQGWQQATTVAAGIEDRPDLLVVSRMLRSRQSAEPLICRHPDVPIETWPVHEFVFLNFKHHGVPLTTEDRKPLVDAYWQRCDPQETNPDAESFEAFWARVISFHEKVSTNSAEKLVVVSHGFFMRAFIWGLSYKFPPCTPNLMKAVYQESIKHPIQNSSVLSLEVDRPSPNNDRLQRHL